MQISSKQLLAGAVIVITAVTAAGAAKASPHASTAPQVTPIARMCAAVTAWSHHRTSANLDAAMADSFHVPWKWPGTDMDQLYVDARDGSSKYIKSDLATILRYDCKK